MGRGKKYKAAQPRNKPPQHRCPICGMKLFRFQSISYHIRKKHPGSRPGHR